MTPHISITLLRTQSDDRLATMTAAGHDRAFEAIVDRYRRPLLRYARRLLRDEARAEDVVQAALVSAWAALRDGVEVRDLRPWLYRIVHNGALNAMKRPEAEPLAELSDHRAGPEAEIERREDVRRAFDGIAALPERQRAALLAVALDGRSHADVGGELGLQDTAVRQLVRRARSSLRAAATALTPYPLVAWAAGADHGADMGSRIGELVAAAGIAGAGTGAGAGLLGGGTAVKAGAMLATAGALAVSAPKVAHVIREDSRPAPAATESSAPGDSPAGAPAPAGGPGGLVPAADLGQSSGDDGAGEPHRSAARHGERRSRPPGSGDEHSAPATSGPPRTDGTGDSADHADDERPPGGSGEDRSTHRSRSRSGGGDGASEHEGSSQVSEPSGSDDATHTDAPSGSEHPSSESGSGDSGSAEEPKGTESGSGSGSSGSGDGGSPDSGSGSSGSGSTDD